jgi:hypothetical protein
VLSVVTGAVQTNGQTYFEDWKLPEGSLYKPIESLIAERARGNEGVKRMALDNYADKVAGDIIQGVSGRIWSGTSEGAKKFAESPFPQSLIVSTLFRRTSLRRTGGGNDRTDSLGVGQLGIQRMWARPAFTGKQMS